jgi:LPXTG-motif cell wall-anchored protein
VASLAAAASVTVFAAGGAAAAPYTPSPVLNVLTTIPLMGDVLSGTLGGFLPGEGIQLDLHTQVFHLESVTADLLGNASFTVQLPKNIGCNHTLVATGLLSGHVATTALDIGNCAKYGSPRSVGDHDHGDGDGGDDGDGDSDSDGGSDDGGSSLPRTGAEVAGLGLLGLTLIGGGSTMVVRRRRSRG